MQARHLVLLVVAGSAMACEGDCTDEGQADRGKVVKSIDGPAERGAEVRDSAEGKQPAPGSGKRTQVVLLGTGTPVPDPNRQGPCVAVVVDGVPYLVDAGPGVVRQAAAARANGVRGLAPDRLEHVFVTHLHSDHTLGLPDVLLSPWVVGRSAPLKVWGPPGTSVMAEHIHRAWSRDIEVRTKGFENKDDTGHRIVATEIEPGPVYRDERVEVSAVAVEHGSWDVALGYRFVTRDRTIVVSGDTTPSKAVIAACDGCDVLVHEVYSSAKFSRLPPSGKRYHGSFHTSTVQLAELALRARPRLLVLYHQLLWGAAPDSLVREIREAGYRGAVVFGRDLDVY